jgi:hypothetical protein
MRIKIILVLAMTIIAALVTPQVSGQTPGLTGKWRGVVTTPDGNELQVTYTFKVTGNQLTGTGESPAGTVTIDDGKVSGESFSFKVTVDGNDYRHTGKFHGDSCDLDIAFGEVIVHTTLTREPN